LKNASKNYGGKGHKGHGKGKGNGKGKGKGMGKRKSSSILKDIAPISI